MDFKGVGNLPDYQQDDIYDDNDADERHQMNVGDRLQ